MLKRENDTLNFVFDASFLKRIYQAEDWDSFRKAVAYQNMLASEPVIVKFK
jgi:hypothetical protein